MSAAAPAGGRPEARTYRNYIGGQWVEGEADKTVPNLNPADTRDVLGHVPFSSAE